MPLGPNDNKSYGVSDFERYYSGGMTAQEMHALEKAALDDPFLADALEGYKATRTPAADVAWLKEQLADKTQKARVVPLAPKKSYPILRIAALVFLLMGAGWSVYYLADSKKDKLAIDDQQQEAPTRKTAPVVVPDTASKEMRTLQQEEAPVPASPQAATPRRNTTSATVTTQPEETATAAAPPVGNVTIEAPKTMLRTEDLSRDVAVAQRKQTVPQALEGQAAGVQVNKAGNQPAQDNRIAVRGANTLNTFQGRVVDANHQGVPNAVVSVQGNRAAVTTNNEGYFSLRATDTIVNANVAAIGFESLNVALNRGKEDTTIVLNPNNQSLEEVVVVGYGVKKRQRMSGSVSTNTSHPQPVNGWEAFNDYLQKQRKPAKELSSGNQKGSVTLSFDVNRKGVPVDIKVDSSLSPRHDEEAVRLLREGPKWQRVKGTRGKVTIPFQ
jgi:hypothetical protein